MTAQASPESGTRTPLLDIRNLTVDYVGPRGARIRAVDGVELTVNGGETVALVGESGSGKSTIGRAVLGLAPVASGSIRFADADITSASAKTRRTLSAELQVIFQDPYGSLNPVRTIGQTLDEPLLVHHKLDRAEINSRIADVLRRVGLEPAAARRYPREFSGGQRQRIAIARALMLSPRLIICDEPVSALDLSVQAQVLNLLRSLQRELSLSYLFIAHDLAVVRHLSHRVVVLYRGSVMEEGPAALVCTAPMHPYTQALVAAAPLPDPKMQAAKRLNPIERVPAPVEALSPNVCPFSTRCPHVRDVCVSKRPPLMNTTDGRRVACFRWSEIERPAAVELPASAVPPFVLSAG